MITSMEKKVGQTLLSMDRVRAVVVSALLLWGADLGASPVTELLEAGIKSYSAAEFKRSLRTLQQASSKARAPEELAQIQLYIGLNQLELGRTTEGREAFRKTLHQDPRVVLDPVANRPKVVAAFEAIRAELAGFIELNSSPPGVRVTLDGRAVGRTPLKLRVKPGKHRLSLSVARHRPWSRTVLMRALGKIELQAALVPLRTAAAIKPAASRARTPAPPTPAPRPALDLDDGRRQRGRKTILGYAGLGSALACAVTAGVLYGVGISRGDAAHALYQEAPTPDAASLHRSDVEAAEKLVLAGHIVAGVGLLAAGFATYQLLTRPEATGRRSSLRRPRLGFVTLDHGAGIALSTTF